MILMNYYQVKLIKTLSEHNTILLWLAIIWTAIVAFLCLASFNSLPKVSLANTDKYVHATFHFGITFLWALVYKFKDRNENKKVLVKAFLFSFFYGIAIEICQAQFTQTRSGDPMDVLANTAGSMLAVVFLILLGNRFYRVAAENKPQ